jgi:hypothetical protein
MMIKILRGELGRAVGCKTKRCPKEESNKRASSCGSVGIPTGQGKILRESRRYGDEGARAPASASCVL